MNFRADLHCHSTCSDGILSPRDLLHLAHKEELQGLAISDHDSIKAYDEALFQEADHLGLSLLPASELSCRFEGESVHVLAYSFSPKDLGIQELCRRQAERRTQRNALIFSSLREKGIEISFEDFPHQLSLGRLHIANHLFEKGLVKTVQEAFTLYLQDSLIPKEDEVLEVSEALELIHQSRAFASLAHPHFLAQKVLTPLLSLGFDGIEARYAQLPPYRERPYLRLAKRWNLFVSGGSDFHGGRQRSEHLGSSWVGEELFSQLYKRFQENRDAL